MSLLYSPLETAVPGYWYSRLIFERGLALLVFSRGASPHRTPLHAR
jgi:hypothetical protein